MAELRAVNLNLLVALDALVAERSVTRAARRVGVTQSAMSSSLAQLRALFDDPLFRRTSHGMEPTPRAIAIAADIRVGLSSFERALSPRSFDPKTAQRSFVVATSDFVELVLLPRLLERLAREAPGVRLELVPWGLHEVPPSLERAEADLMIGFYDKVPPRHRHALLFDDVFTCIVRRAHPRVKSKLTLKTWLELPHVLVSQRPGSPGAVDRALAARGKSRIVGARVSHFLLAPIIVARTDMVAAVSALLADVFAPALRLRRFAPPIPLPKGRVGQVWHEQVDADPANRWLRTIIAEEARKLG
ncbi:MAG: LysR family transcriptional regulator [Polyangiaceae bacterium]|nr:LysR family transcriptional regulator [Polyangiaceae bacterium]